MDVVKTNLGDIDLDRLRDSACFAIGVGPWERGSLSPMGELRLAGYLAYADWVARDRELSTEFAESWSAAAEADWADLSPEAKADALAFARVGFAACRECRPSRLRRHGAPKGRLPRAANHEAIAYLHRHIGNLPACPWTKRFIEHAERLRR